MTAGLTGDEVATGGPATGVPAGASAAGPTGEPAAGTDGAPRRDRLHPTDRELARRAETGTGELRLDLTRRLAAEALGTAMLIVAVVGSGIAASRLSAGDVGLQLLENAAATAGALVGLIVMFGAVSGAHFNPVVTLLDRMLGTTSTRDTGLYVVAQVAGGCMGTMLANVMFELPAVELSTTDRSSGALWLSEVVATVTLLLLIQGCVRTGRGSVVPFAVGAWIGGAYWFTSSTSFANPAVTVARTLSDSFAGIAPASAPMFVVMQLVGVLIAFGLVRLFYPHDRSESPG
jgi:glycerol uptake facilitator-like aquaporin